MNNNQITLAGHVGQDPHSKTFGDTGNQVVKFSIAVKEYSANKDEERTLWIDVDAWNGSVSYTHLRFRRSDWFLAAQVEVMQFDYWLRLLYSHSSLIRRKGGNRQGTIEDYLTSFGDGLKDPVS